MSVGPVVNIWVKYKHLLRYEARNRASSWTVYASRERTRMMTNHLGKTENLEDFHAGPLCIKNMRVYALCSKGKAYTDDIRVDFEPMSAAQRPLPKAWAVIEATVLPQLQAAAEDQGALFKNGPQVDMVSARFERDKDRTPDVPNRIIVKWAETRYFYFAAMSNRLDKEVDGLAPAPVTLRHLWTDDRPIGLYDVHTLQSPAEIGTVGVVVTKDNKLLAHYRSAQDYQVSGGLHFLGEGMLPEDCNASKTPYDPPCQTVKRALREELGLENEVIENTQVIPTAFVFDTERWQPVFCYIVRVPLNASDFMLPTARDSFEAQTFVQLRFDIHAADQRLCQLLLGSDPWRHLSLNHGSMALYAALVWKFGSDVVSKALSDVVSKARKASDNSMADFHAGPSLCIKNMRVYALCRKGKAYTDVIRVDFDPMPAAQRPLPKAWAVIEAAAKDQQALFNNGPQVVDMVNARIDRDKERRPDKPNRIIVKWAPVTLRGRATLRHLWTDDRPIGLYDVHTLQSPAVIGTVAVVVTEDMQLLAHYRRKPDGKIDVHFLSEDMQPEDCGRPKDSDPSKTPNDPPCQTVKRALQKELGQANEVLANEVIENTQVIPTAFVFDTERWQPVFCYIVRVRRLCRDVQPMLPTAVKLRFNSDADQEAPPQELCQLLLNKDLRRHLSSNHASMALYAALVWQFGSDVVSKALGSADNSRKE